MNAGRDPDIARVRDLDSCREWLRALPDDDNERLAAIGSLVASLSHPRIGGDLLFEMLEPVRIVQLRTIERLLAPLAGRAVPYSQAEWQRLNAALANLRASRNLYKRVYTQMLRGEGEETHSTIPGASDTLRVVMPLVRGLDAQARVVALLLRNRAVPSAADWDELCVLARHVRRTSFQDEALPDEMPLVRPTTARALFVYPVLLECSALPARSITESNFTQQLASRICARIGYRIDHGAPRENAHGPRIALSADYAVRLDTHRVPAILARRRQQWLPSDDAPPPASLPMTSAMLSNLLDDLERRWTEPGPPLSTGAHPVAARAVRSVRLRFGLPKMHSADMRIRIGDGAAQLSPAAAESPRSASSRYDYGRWEQNTIIRLALGSPGERADPVGLLMAEGEMAMRLADRLDGRIVVARAGTIPRAAIGSLVAVSTATDAADAAKAGAKPGPKAPRKSAAGSELELTLGCVEAIEQLSERESAPGQNHRLAIRVWEGAAVPVGIRVGQSTFFEDGWLLRGNGGFELPCVVMAPGRANGGAHGLLREGGSDIAIRFVSVLDRGSGYERLSVRIEPMRS